VQVFLKCRTAPFPNSFRRFLDCVSQNRLGHVDSTSQPVCKSVGGLLTNQLTSHLISQLTNELIIVNAMVVNVDGALVTGGDNGSLWFWDWKSGHNFQKQQAQVQVFFSSFRCSRVYVV